MKNPKHLAIIMDGNGRWASNRHHNRYYGHLRGAKVARNIIEHCSRMEIPYLTLFAFSTENWKRPETEINFLMKLLIKYLKSELNKLIESDIVFNIIGEPLDFPQNVQDILIETIEKTKSNKGMNLTFALNYGGKQDITAAFKNIAKKISKNILTIDEISEETIQENFNSSFLPDPDLIIRTSNEQRLSNFFLWQAAYSEFHFCDKLWPDFTTQDLDLALHKFSSRDRRFGKVSSEAPPLSPQPNESHS